MLKNNNVANLLVGKRNTTLLNTMVKDNSIMDIEMNKMIENLENKIPTEISDKKEIYRTINSGEAIMSDDPTIPDNLINNHSKSNYVVKVKIIDIDIDNKRISISMRALLEDEAEGEDAKNSDNG